MELLLYRQVGGAYGGFSDFDSHSGMYTYLSYRDPNVLKTIESYDGTPDFLRTLELDNDALTKAIIGTIGDIDSYQLPDSKVQFTMQSGLVWRLAGIISGMLLSEIIYGVCQASYFLKHTLWVNPQLSPACRATQHSCGMC